MPITALFAAFLTALFVILSVRVIAQRRSTGAALGDGGDEELLRRIRAQGNFVEYAPLGLILLGLAEQLHAPDWLLYPLGLTLLAGRALHAFGVSMRDERFMFRVSGMAFTLTMLIAAAITCATMAALFTYPG